VFRTAAQVRGVKPGVQANAWTVIGIPFSRGKADSRRGGVNWAVVAQCSCGRVCVLGVKSICDDRTTNCRSCQTAKRNTVHGGCRTPLYVCWRNMRSRCESPGSDDFHRYGARGISVCSEWHDFGTFRSWAMDSGYRPSLTLERKRVNEGYCPDNCTWADRTQQARNRRSSRFIEHDGKRLTLIEWAHKTGIGQSTINFRLKSGWSVTDALTKPPRRAKICK